MEPFLRLELEGDDFVARFVTTIEGMPFSCKRMTRVL